MAALPGSKSRGGDFGLPNQGKIFTSDDRGQTWVHRADFPFMHARPFVAGAALYIIGHDHDLCIIRSDDNGEAWSQPFWLTSGQHWHQAPANVHYAHSCVYLVMERVIHPDVQTWAVSVLAPVLMRGKVGADLTRREAWTFASELVFRDVVPTEGLDYFGVPFYDSPRERAVEVAPGRSSTPQRHWLLTHYLGCDKLRAAVRHVVGFGSALLPR